MLHPNPTAPYTVRSLLSTSEFYPSYEKPGQTDCLTQMTTIPNLPHTKHGSTANPGLHLQENANLFYGGETTRPMYMKSDVPSHPNGNNTTSQIHEGPPQGKDINRQVAYMILCILAC